MQGCRSRRAAYGPWSKDLGSSRLASAPRGAQAQPVKKRRKPDREAQAQWRYRWRVPRDPTRERESVSSDRGREHSYDGRRPGPVRSWSLTRPRSQRDLGGHEAKGAPQRCGARRGPRQRMSEAMVAALALCEERRDQETPLRRSRRSRLHQDRAASALTVTSESSGHRERVAALAEVGGPPSSGAPPVGSFGKRKAGSQARPRGPGLPPVGAGFGQSEPARGVVTRRKTGSARVQPESCTSVGTRGVSGGCRRRRETSALGSWRVCSRRQRQDVHSTGRDSSRRRASLRRGRLARGERRGCR